MASRGPPAPRASGGTFIGAAPAPDPSITAAEIALVAVTSWVSNRTRAPVPLAALRRGMMSESKQSSARLEDADIANGVLRNQGLIAATRAHTIQSEANTRQVQESKARVNGLAATKATIREFSTFKYEATDTFQVLNRIEEKIFAVDQLQDEFKPIASQFPRCSDLLIEARRPRTAAIYDQQRICKFECEWK
ncbi:hypothetical protein LTR37_008942 [Vermiconidia calcicola]|uniref:Uncharacterized protein n=1 Tax=Vermiconidia calcicola TaxID=1690605 RepID=A0ACC3NAA7_9PEZI|nr:hypothetical protein LTR37_008942 [Vermiconidia calcicola]